MPGKINNAGIICDGPMNPNWKGGPIDKICEVCGKNYQVKRPQAKSRFCSLQCVGVSQRKPVREWAMASLKCLACDKEFEVPKIWAHRTKTCSVACKNARHGERNKGHKNPNWNGGLSRFPYPWNFTIEISPRIIERDGRRCQNPGCSGRDARMVTHHINYDKQDCRDENLIAVCSSCNSRANFDRPKWQAFYSALMAKRLAAQEVA